MGDLKRGSKFIFVGGAPRSGTTLVQNMLDSHPNIFGGPEFIHVPDIIHLRKRLHGSIARGWIDLFCSHDDVDNELRSLIENLLLPAADRDEGNKFLSEKTPGNVLVFSELLTLFPEAHFIHVVRDPRATIASMLQVGMRAKRKGIETATFTANSRVATNYVKKCLKAGFTVAKAAPEKVLTIHYERLVIDPERETKKICDFLELGWSDRMLTPSDFRHLGEQAITVNSGQIWYDPAMYNRNPEARHINKWKTLLTSSQQVEIATSFKNDAGLAQMGYDFSMDELSRTNYFFSLAYNKFIRLTGRVLRKVLSLVRMPLT
ncbi:MAG: sulfotransferase [Chloroflexi bacterium]|nr:sulfotransferase [Chloroflexota bacterium]